ncbi:MAG: helicase-related protein, partial [Myxococcales bacterium]|nr:helicase-related protein [Myxococcales bacterium]
SSRRTALLLGNMADHAVLFTATPINRGAHDLISIVNLLGADNLDDAGLKIVGRNWRRSSGLNLQPEEISELRREVQRFTVRRTKRALNELIDREPEAYLNRLAQPCRYPATITESYSLEESEDDRAIAAAIRELAGGLRGLVNLRSPLEPPERAREERTPEEYVQLRLRGAAGLARYHVMASLRSSRAALIEHLRGTNEARRRCNIERKFKSMSTGAVIETIAARRQPPSPRPLEPYLPDFLRDDEAFLLAVREEIAIYEAIDAQAAKLSDRRERARIELLERLWETHGLVLAFDSRPISLALLAERLGAHGDGVLLATGSSKEQERAKVNERFALGSATRSAIALCSDAMSEGLNLQASSVIVHLDMPSVIRVAEQRIGRIDRMDSSHARIQVYWPRDAEEFALRQDERFLARHELVAGLLGANIELPQEIGTAVVDHRSLMQEEPAEAALELEDAFTPIRALVQGPNAVIPEAIYEQMRGSEAKVVSAVSVVRARAPWAFFALRATERSTPRWALIDPTLPRPLATLDEIADALRQRLGSQTEDLDLDDRAAQLLERFVGQLERSERLLLPPKKRRALKEMEFLLEHYLRDSKRPLDAATRELLENLLATAKGEPQTPYADPRDIAQCWLELIRPRWHRHLLDRRRRGMVLLRDLRRSLRADPLEPEAIQRAFAGLEPAPPLRDRIAAAIVGIPHRGSSTSS